ncbi:alpha/beta hydrolase [Oleiharenicola lentus]|uniref:alpha/beta hydrolase n=1 Tax=Oleiharenicola lentus TaxID=2508720 RepID=UPI003F67189D
MKLRLLLLSLCVALFSSLHAADAAPSKPVIVFVHGAWGGGWQFKKVQPLLEARGYQVWRPTLTGLGERSHLATRDIGLATHIEDIVNFLRFENLTDVILVGHSYGGMVVTGVVDRAPERIKRVIYLDAMVPSDGESAMSVRGARPDMPIEKMAKDGFVIPFWVKADKPYPRDVPHPLKTFTDPIELKNPAAKKVHASYILTVDKGKTAEQDDFYAQSLRAKERGWPVVQMEADHNPQWFLPEATVEQLLSIP